jgi:hypothetical protein
MRRISRSFIVEPLIHNDGSLKEGKHLTTEFVNGVLVFAIHSLENVDDFVAQERTASTEFNRVAACLPNSNSLLCSPEGLQPLIL